MKNLFAILLLLLIYINHVSVLMWSVFIAIYQVELPYSRMEILVLKGSVIHRLKHFN